MAHITKTTIANPPSSVVVPGAIRSSPEFWPEWFVGLSAPTSKKGDGEVSTVSEHSMRIARLDVPFTHMIIESTNDGIEARWKGTFTGALEGWHQWTYHFVNGLTEVAVDLAFVERVIAKMLEHSAENLMMLTEARVAT